MELDRDNWFTMGWLCKHMFLIVSSLIGEGTSASISNIFLLLVALSLMKDGGSTTDTAN